MEKASPLGPSACCSAFPEATAWVPLRGGAGRMGLRCSLPGGLVRCSLGALEGPSGHLVERQAAGVRCCREQPCKEAWGDCCSSRWFISFLSWAWFSPSQNWVRKRKSVLEGPDDTSLWEQEVLWKGMAACKASLPADLTRFQNRRVGINLKWARCQKELLKLSDFQVVVPLKLFWVSSVFQPCLLSQKRSHKENVCASGPAGMVLMTAGCPGMRGLDHRSRSEHPLDPWNHAQCG